MKFLQKYHAHINVEVAASVDIGGFLSKHIFKGTGSAAVQVAQRQQQAQQQPQQQQQGGNRENVGDLRSFLTVKYTCVTEANSGSHGFHRQRIAPRVEQLPMHLPQEDCAVVDATEVDVAGITEGNMSAITKYL